MKILLMSFVIVFPAIIYAMQTQPALIEKESERYYITRLQKLLPQGQASYFIEKLPEVLNSRHKFYATTNWYFDASRVTLYFDLNCIEIYKTTNTGNKNDTQPVSLTPQQFIHILHMVKKEEEIKPHTVG